MGLFSKEACVFCGKEVGVMHRSKMQGGDYICTDCKFLTHPFIRIDKVNKEAAQGIMEETARDEEYFQNTQWQSVKRSGGGQNFGFFYSMQTGDFALSTPETKRYKNHPILNMALVRPYDRNLDWSMQQGNTPRFPQLSKQQYQDMITLKEKKGTDGKIEGWEMYIPYFREHMDITINFPGGMKENDVKDFYTQVVGSIAGYNTSVLAGRAEMQQVNAMQTAGAMLKAAIKGEGVEGVAAKMQEGMDTAQDISEGKVKRGLFGRLKK